MLLLPLPDFREVSVFLVAVVILVARTVLSFLARLETDVSIHCLAGHRYGGRSVGALQLIDA